MKAGKKNIVWLASYPKSGNTWFRILLSNFFSSSDSPVNINDLNDSLIASNRSIFDQYVGTNSSDLTSSEIELLRPELYRRLALESKKLIYIKVHDAWKKNINREPLFPNDITRGVIYFIRHPLDVAVSYGYHSGYSSLRSLREMGNSAHGFCTNPEKLNIQLTQLLFSWSEHVISWVDQSGLPQIVIRYEDLYKKTHDEFARALNFLGIPYSESRINTAIKNSSFEIVSRQEKEYGFREKPVSQEKFFREGKIGTWKDHFVPDQVNSFLAENRELMSRFGYTDIP